MNPPGDGGVEVPPVRGIGDLDEVLDNLGVFLAGAEELVLLCPSGFRRVPISQRADAYLSIQALGPGQIAYAHTHPDSEEWTIVLRGTGEARIHGPVPLRPGCVLGRAAAHPHGFRAGRDPLILLSLQAPRPGEAATSWDEPGTTTDPIRCPGGGRCRRCPRCGGHAAEVLRDRFACENCAFRL
ncbi:MAG TPA: cupin domain-containing protein [Actinomycetota bacterium]|nr:cupin domain-containing protein [Actinomycetota bacterium]